MKATIENAKWFFSGVGVTLILIIVYFLDLSPYQMEEKTPPIANLPNKVIKKRISRASTENKLLIPKQLIVKDDIHPDRMLLIIGNVEDTIYFVKDLSVSWSYSKVISDNSQSIDYKVIRSYVIEDWHDGQPTGEIKSTGTKYYVFLTDESQNLVFNDSLTAYSKNKVSTFTIYPEFIHPGVYKVWLSFNYQKESDKKYRQYNSDVCTVQFNIKNEYE